MSETIFRLVPGVFLEKPERVFVVIHEDKSEKEFNFEHQCIAYVRELHASNKRFYVEGRWTMRELVDIVPVK